LTETIFPDTDLRLVYELISWLRPRNSADSLSPQNP
jgi:hypothetical protein